PSPISGPRQNMSGSHTRPHGTLGRSRPPVVLSPSGLPSRKAFVRHAVTRHRPFPAIGLAPICPLSAVFSLGRQRRRPTPPRSPPALTPPTAPAAAAAPAPSRKDLHPPPHPVARGRAARAAAARARPRPAPRRRNGRARRSAATRCARRGRPPPDRGGGWPPRPPGTTPA